MNILEKIIAQKRIEVAERKVAAPVADLERMPLFSAGTQSLSGVLNAGNSTGIIAEFKRRSPSKGVINNNADVTAVATAYAKGGAAGISVLTDETFFGGSIHDLAATVNLPVPVLRKDFMIDPYQLVEAKAYGASVILLIAACLTKSEVRSLAGTARSLGLEVLLEVHNESELEHICPEVNIIGVNNRDLKTFSVSIDTSLKLLPHFPAGVPAISESGIADVETITTLRAAGFKGFLVGEQFMKAPDPAIAFAAFVQTLKAKQCN